MTNGAASYPVPLAVEQANSSGIVAGDKFNVRNESISKMMSMHGANHKHFELAISCPVRFPDK